MQYVCIVLILIVLLLAIRLYFLQRALHIASNDMEQIEAAPEQNRQLTTGEPALEQLIRRINILYIERQKERIDYQRREQLLRQEIENISHDLRTPLTSILGYLDLLSDEDTSTAEREEYLTIIQKRARILQNFIQDFYEISRIEADDFPLQLTSLPVQNVLKEAALAFYLNFEQRDIQVTVSLEEKPCYIIADKIQFERIINNLIQNALKYANKQFTLKQTSTENYCYLQFINDAPTINQDELSRVFERFYTGDPSRSSQSSGLGLTITKILTEKMNGQIEVRVEHNLFIIELRWSI